METITIPKAEYRNLVRKAKLFEEHKDLQIAIQRLKDKNDNVISPKQLKKSLGI
ncbi:MAG: hypothetical protein IPM96_22005 [Ignavibacteria bacterium]|nr:hypothetical protein [Ignavibacteria bacterium]